MRSCPTCQRTYEDLALSYCLDDGTPLVDIYDSQATLVNPEPLRGYDTEPTRANTAPPRPSEPTLVVRPSYNYLPPPSAPGNAAKRSSLVVPIAVGALLILIVGLAGGAGLMWLAWPAENSNESGVRIRSPSPSGSETPDRRSTPEKLAEVSGTWRGSWRNSKGETGTTTITIYDGGDGTITGGEGEDYPMVDGRREGNTLTWTYKASQDGCFDYTCIFEVDTSGNRGHGTYEVEDKCNNTTFSGWYEDYEKQ